MSLTPAKVKNHVWSGARKFDKLPDGNGLWLFVGAAGKYWRMPYRFNGKQLTYSIGVYPEVTLAEARAARDAAKRELAQGLDPGQQKRIRKLQRYEESGNTFQAVAKRWFDQWAVDKAEGTKAAKWKRLEQDVFPHFGSLPIREVTTPMVVTAVKTVNKRGARDVAERILNTCAQVFRYAVAHSDADRNPAVDVRPADILPVHTVKHFARVTEQGLPDLLRAMYGYSGRGEWQTSYALQLLCLTFVRTSELIGGRWEEIDWDNARWTIPAERMKKVRGRPMTDHVVPLCSQALEVLRKLQQMHGHREFIFYSQRSASRHMSDGTMLQALHRMGYKGIMTGHGYRGLATTILVEHGFPIELVDLQLSHKERNKVRAAYNDAVHLPKRAELMQWWGDYVATCTAENIIMMPKRAAA